MTPSNSRHATDDYASDGQGETIATPVKSAAATPTQGSPVVNSTQSSSSLDEPDSQARERARESSEAAALKKTGWLLLRSSARNLTNVLKHAGATGLRVLQLYNFTVPSDSRPLAFFLMYKWAPDRGDRVTWNPERMRNPDTQVGHNGHQGMASFVEDDSSSVQQQDVLFCGQTMDNATTTQALILALLNISETGDIQPPDSADSNAIDSTSPPTVETTYNVGDSLRVLKTFIRPMDPVLRAAAICSSTAVREAHNNAAHEQLDGHPDLLDEDAKVRTSLLAEELWMYSAYVPTHNGSVVYEMEGMGDGARVLAHCSPSNPDQWVDTVFDSLKERVDVFRQHNVQFLLFALSTDNRTSSNSDVPQIPQKGNPARMDSGEEPVRSTSGGRRKREDDGDDDSNDDESNDSNDSNDDEDDTDDDSNDEYDEETMTEEVERISATHNYEMFFVEMLKLMASRGDINSLIRGQDASRDTRNMHD